MVATFDETVVVVVVLDVVVVVDGDDDVDLDDPALTKKIRLADNKAAAAERSAY